LALNLFAKFNRATMTGFISIMLVVGSVSADATAADGVGASASTVKRNTGVRLTDEARLHPLVQAAFAWDSNPNFLSEASGDAMLIVEGGFEVLVPSDKLELRLSTKLNYNHYFGVATDGEDETQTSTSKLSGFKFDGNVQVLANRRGRMRWGLMERLRRLDDPQPQVLGARQGRWNSRTGGFMMWRPGGQAMGFKPSFALAADFYDPSAVDGYHPEKYNQMSPELKFDFDWRFLPRTSVIWNTRWATSVYPNEESGSLVSDPLSSEIGLMGQVSARMSIILAAGYAQSTLYFAEAAAEPSAVGHAEVRYDEDRRRVFRLGFRRQMTTAQLHGYATDNQIYARYSERYRGGFRLLTNTSVSMRSYGPTTNQELIKISDGSSTRFDISGKVNVSLLWQPKKWWVAGVTNRLDLLDTNALFSRPTGGNPGDVSETDPGYFRNLTMLLFEAKY
jgi:hypothetical protein